MTATWAFFLPVRVRWTRKRWCKRRWASQADVGDGLGQTFLAFFQVGTHPRRGTILPGGFDEGAAGDGVASFGDAALAAFIARGVLAGNQAQIVHQLGGMAEAVEVAEFGDEGGRRGGGRNPRNAIKARTTGSATPAGHGQGDFHKS